MHEFSIIQGMVDIVKDAALRNNVQHVTLVEIEVGQAAGVVKEALEFAWQSFTDDPVLLKTQLVIREVPLVMLCRSCQQTFHPSEIYEPCPSCGDVNGEILKGKELKVLAIET